MKVIRFYVGVGEDLHGAKIANITRERMVQDAHELLSRHFGGFTEFGARGDWIGPTELVTEASLVFEVAVPQASPNNSGKLFALIAAELKAIFQQTSDLYIALDAKGEFV